MPIEALAGTLFSGTTVGFGLSALVLSIFNARNAKRQIASSEQQQAAAHQHQDRLQAGRLQFEREQLERSLAHGRELEEWRWRALMQPLRHPGALLTAPPQVLRVVLLPPASPVLTNRPQDGQWGQVLAQGLYSQVAFQVQSLLRQDGSRAMHLVDPSVLNPGGLRGVDAVHWLQSEPGLGDVPVLWLQIDRVDEDAVMLSGAFWGAGREAGFFQLERLPVYELAQCESGRSDAPLHISIQAMQLLVQTCLTVIFAATDAHFLALGQAPLLPQLLRSPAVELQRPVVLAALAPVLQAYEEAAASLAAAHPAQAGSVWLSLAECLAEVNPAAAPEVLQASLHAVQGLVTGEPGLAEDVDSIERLARMPRRHLRASYLRRAATLCRRLGRPDEAARFEALLPGASPDEGPFPQRAGSKRSAPSQAVCRLDV